ncbi:N-terminal nucleophile aminohydrolase [Clavulina sp. PMI_390]|nr:N-terminal nucleophile aminohydrolase [Clavulina sp. PMI_390]
MPSHRKSSKGSRPTLVIHGGAGAIRREGSTVEQQERYRNALRGALLAGHEVLNTGGEAMDAAVAAVAFMEDCPLFNSGHGAVFNSDGKNELESSLMLSKPPASHPEVPASRRGFALSLLSHARNPIKAARELYLAHDLTPHVLLSGTAAEQLAQKLGAEMVDPSYFWTPNRWREHRKGLGLPEQPYPPGVPADEEKSDYPLDQLPKGTVGAVALDERGCIAAATSTGGLTNKLPGRIGDTPQLSAGFFAAEWKPRGWLNRAWRHVHGKNAKRAVGISGTGNGDYFVRQGTAAKIAHRMEFLGESVSKAASKAVKELAEENAQGGVIAIDEEGNAALPLNSPGMYRGIIREDGVPLVAIFSDEELA